MAHLTDMEELLATIPSAQIRDYMRESMSCYMAGAYRGSIVLSYIALFDDVLEKLGELASVNIDAKAIFTEASKKKASQDVYESYLIDQLGSKKLLSRLDASFLNTLRNLRNKSAHPSGHKPSPEEARFIFFETISRFLSRPILSTTQLVDEIISRLGNSNFFPSIVATDIQAVVDEEISALHSAAIPQLVQKLVFSVSLSGKDISGNAARFLIGLSLLNSSDVNKELKSKLLSAKSDDPQYATLVLQVLSANGSLVVGLSSTSISRIKSILSKKIDDLTPAFNESNLSHPTQALISVAGHLEEVDFIANFKPEIEKLFDNRPYSTVWLDGFSKLPAVFELYFSIILEKAGSSQFGIANTFSNTIESLDAVFAALMTNEQAFKLIVAVHKAAEWGSFGADGLIQTKFAGTSEIRSKAVSYISDKEEDAGAYLDAEVSSAKPIEEFISEYLTDEPEAEQ